MLAGCDQLETHLWRPADLTAVLDTLAPDIIRVHVQ
jgi:hypothetical protein